MAVTILGIDPGSRTTGIAVIESQGQTLIYRHSGYIHVAKAADVSARLQLIFSATAEVIAQYQPTEASVEQVFMHANPSAALKLGQARGAALVAIGQQELRLAEYTARQVKQSVVGYGAATKEQVQHMVRNLLHLDQDLQADEADALAIALCHAHARKGLTQLLGTRSRRRGRSR